MKSKRLENSAKTIKGEKIIQAKMFSNNLMDHVVSY